MKVVVQRTKGRCGIVSKSSDREEAHEFMGPGLVVLLGWTKGDEVRADLAKAEEWLISRVQGLRIFPDPEGRMNLSLEDYLKGAGGEGGILWVSQFTLAGSLESGFRPSFIDAMAPAAAQARFEMLTKKLAAESHAYRQIFGIFGADMDLSFTNWGPVTIPLER